MLSSPTEWISAIATVTGLPMGANLRQKVTAQEASMGHWKGPYPWPFSRDPIRLSSDMTSRVTD